MIMEATSDLLDWMGGPIGPIGLIWDFGQISGRFGSRFKHLRSDVSFHRCCIERLGNDSEDVYDSPVMHNHVLRQPRLRLQIDMINTEHEFRSCTMPFPHSLLA